MKNQIKILAVISAAFLAVSFFVSPFIFAEKKPVKIPLIGAASIPIVEKVYNGDIVTVGGVSTYSVHGKEVNYLAADGFKTIDPAFQRTTNGFQMLDAPFQVFLPETADGIARFVNNNRFDIFSKKNLNENDLSVEIQAENVNPVAGVEMRGDLTDRAGLQKNVPYVLYPSAYASGADLIYYVHTGPTVTLEKLVRIKNAGEFVANPSFKIRYSSVVDLSRKVSGKDTKWSQGSKLTLNRTGLTGKRAEGRAISFREFTIWDSTPKTTQKQKIDVTIDPKDAQGWYTLTKILPAGFLTSAVFPVYTDSTITVYPDANPETTSVDGYSSRQGANESFATIQAGAGSVADDTAVTVGLELRSTTSSNQYQKLFRGFILFDTSAIGSGATVSSGTITLTSVGSVDTQFALSVCISGPSAPASNTAVVASDYGSAGASEYSSTRYTYATWGTPGAYVFTLNSGGVSNVSTTGVSKYGVKNSADMDSSAPTWGSDKSDEADYSNAETAGTGSDPVLNVTYTAAAGGGGVTDPGFNFIPNIVFDALLPKRNLL